MGNNNNTPKIMTQKHLNFTIILLLLSTFSFSQSKTENPKENKWTAGLILMSEQNSYLERTFSPNFFSGIIIKRQLKHFTTRIGFEYSKQIDKVDPPQCCDQIFSQGYTKESMIRLGVEKNIVVKKGFKTYIALDLAGIKSYSDKTFAGGFTGNYNTKILTSLSGFGVIPAVGFEQKIFKKLSLALETRVRFISTKTTQDIDDLNDTNGSNRKQDNSFLSTFNRIGVLKLNYNF